MATSPSRSTTRYGSPLRPLLGAALLALLAGGCAGTGASLPVVSASGGGAADSTGGASSCGTAIANFEKVVTADGETGNLNASVYKRVQADLRPVKATCAAGKDAQALAQLASVRSHYGYP